MVSDATPLFARDFQTGLMAELNLANPRSLLRRIDGNGADPFRVPVLDDHDD